MRVDEKQPEMHVTIRSPLYARAAVVAIALGICACASIPPLVFGHAFLFFLVAGSIVFQRYELRRESGHLRLRGYRFGILLYDDRCSGPEPFFPFERRPGRRTNPGSRWTVALRGASKPHVLWFYLNVDRALSLARSLNRLDGATPRTFAWPCFVRARGKVWQSSSWRTSDDSKEKRRINRHCWWGVARPSVGPRHALRDRLQ